MSTRFREISSLSTRGDKIGFTNALSVWINKPHVVNRRLCGTKIISFNAQSKADLRFKHVIDKLKHLGYQLNDSDERILAGRLSSDLDASDGANSKIINLENSEELITLEHQTDDIIQVKAEELTNVRSIFSDSKEDTLGIANEDSKDNKFKTNICTDNLNLIIHESRTGNGDGEDLIKQVETEPHITSKIAEDSPEYKQSDTFERRKQEDGNTNSNRFTSANVVRNIDTDFHHRFGNCISENLSEVEGLADSEYEAIVIVRELVPKQPDRHKNIPELVIYDKSCETCVFYPLHKTLHQGEEEPQKRIEVAYEFSYDTKSVEQKNVASITLSVSCTDFTDDSRRKLSLTWLEGQLLKKIVRWSEEPKLKTSLTSLKLVPLEEYNVLYNDLKIKYGQHFAKIWPEKTDPQKYVYEDVAIATYLLLLWKTDREKKGLSKKQSFLDLGCGNGLLVHILASEGHPGYGVDVRKRNIWDIYGEETILKETPITPSRDSLFPDSDWLIGNHSDELTPWIPVMAARSCYSCCYFVLPCCHHDFDSKFSQSVVGGSQYREYLNYIQTVGENCGFIVEEDMLRIPSTKRVCFVGRSRSYPVTDEPLIDEKRTLFINSRCNQNKPQTERSVIASDQSDKNPALVENWSVDFAPRSKIETTRNCVTVRKETKEVVIRTVFDKLMSSDICEVKQLDDGRKWRKGGKLPISDVVKLFDGNLLQELKSECGGIQTLLRNSSQIFQVTSGIVQLRDFTLEDPWGRKQKGKRASNSDYFKTSLCWFNRNHPDGCPKIPELCDYAHCETELRERPQKVKKLT